MRNERARFGLGAVVVLCAVTAVIASDFDINWWTIDGGGEMFLTGGDFEVSGTIGQPDASTTVLTGGGFEVTGGFWTRAAGHEVTPVTPESVEPLDDVVDDIAPKPGPP